MASYESLPPEVKYNIFQLMFPHRSSCKKKLQDTLSCCHASQHLMSTKPSFQSCLPFLRACKEAHTESTAVLYGTNTFNFSDTTSESRVSYFKSLPHAEAEDRLLQLWSTTGKVIPFSEFLDVVRHHPSLLSLCNGSGFPSDTFIPVSYLITQHIHSTPAFLTTIGPSNVSKLRHITFCFSGTAFLLDDDQYVPDDSVDIETDFYLNILRPLSATQPQSILAQHLDRHQQQRTEKLRGKRGKAHIMKEALESLREHHHQLRTLQLCFHGEDAENTAHTFLTRTRWKSQLEQVLSTPTPTSDHSNSSPIELEFSISYHRSRYPKPEEKVWKGEWRVVAAQFSEWVYREKIGGIGGWEMGDGDRWFERWVYRLLS